jgi:hypothetical protein
VKFRPGGFAPFVRIPMSDLTDRAAALRNVFGSAASDLEHDVLASRDAKRKCDLMDAFSPWDGRCGVNVEAA